MNNFTPGRYRGVSISGLDFPLEPQRLMDYFTGREAYKTTEFIVCRQADDTTLLRVTKEQGPELFLRILTVEVLAGTDECAYVAAPDVDTGVPSDLARAARELAPGKRCVVVQGLYEHVNFILDPVPVPVRVVDVAPPSPPKLLDQVRRVLQTAERLAPVELRPEITDLVALASQIPSEHYLYPCRGSGAAPEGAGVSYLDQRPAEEKDWTLVGCARSRQIYSWFYGTEPPNIDFCPRKLAALPQGGGGNDPTMTKCCLLETGYELTGSTVTVPWGASLAEVYEALQALVGSIEPAWAPE